MLLWLETLVCQIPQLMDNNKHSWLTPTEYISSDTYNAELAAFLSTKQCRHKLVGCLTIHTVRADTHTQYSMSNKVQCHL